MLQVKIVPVTAFQQNCSILWDSDSKEAVLIDAGGEPEKLKAEVEALGLTVKALWLTHGHLDHAGAVGALKKVWDVPVIGPHKDDAFWLDMIQEVSARYGFPIPEKVEVTQWLEGGEVLKLGDEEFEVRFAPGHTPGHVMFYNKNHALLWTGDVLFKGSIGRTDFPRGDHQQYSIQSSANVLACRMKPSLFQDMVRSAILVLKNSIILSLREKQVKVGEKISLAGLFIC
jgi:Zn-dependent hydrolases, including glyoxylases